MDNELYSRLEQFAEEAQSSRKEAYEESLRRKKAEKDVIDAFRRVSVCTGFLDSDLFFKQIALVSYIQTCIMLLIQITNTYLIYILGKSIRDNVY